MGCDTLAYFRESTFVEISIRTLRRSTNSQSVVRHHFFTLSFDCCSELLVYFQLRYRVRGSV